MLNKILLLPAKIFLGKGIDKKMPWLVDLYQQVYFMLAKDQLKTVNIPLKQKLIVSTKDAGVGLYLLNKGQFEPQQTKLFVSQVKKSSIVLDIGANIGYYTVLASKLVGQKGRVFAFEPDPRNIKLLKQNLKLNNCTNVNVINKAVARQSGKLGFAMLNQSQGQSRLNNQSSKTVNAISLNDFYKQHKIVPDVIKMDIEGVETDVLRGGAELWQNSKKTKLFLECNTKSLQEFNLTYKTLLVTLENFGFKTQFILNEFNKSKKTFNQDKLGKTLDNYTFVNLYAEKKTKGLLYKSAKKPLISVIMTAFNAQKFIKPAISSILNQTYKNLELIIVNDGSKDNTLKILKQIKKQDSRIKIISSTKNMGPSFASNLALKQAKGQYIARMDSDDIALPKRLEQQLNFLQKNPDIVAVGGQCRLIDEKGKNIGLKNYPVSHKAIYNSLFMFNPIQHPTIMINRSLLPSGNIIYKNGSVLAHDLELVFELAQYGKLANLRAEVLKYRQHQNSLSLKNPKKTFNNTLNIRKKSTVEYLYKPSIKGKMINILQTMAVKIIPADYIYLVFSLIRGIKRLNFSQVINLDFKWQSLNLAKNKEIR